MNVHSKDDKCCCDWKQQIKQMWERLQTTIYGVKVNGTRVYPDGDGIVNIVIGESGIPIATEEAIGGVLSASADGKVSVDPLTGEMTANGLSDAIDDVEQLESEIIALQNEDINLGNRLTSAEGRLTTVEADIDEHDQDIVTLDGRVDALDTAVSGLQTGKQDILISGANIKTINGESVLGAGNIDTIVKTLNYESYTWAQYDIDPSAPPVTATANNPMPGASLPLSGDAVAFNIASTKSSGANSDEIYNKAVVMSIKNLKDLSPRNDKIYSVILGNAYMISTTQSTYAKSNEHILKANFMMHNGTLYLMGASSNTKIIHVYSISDTSSSFIYRKRSTTSDSISGDTTVRVYQGTLI